MVVCDSCQGKERRNQSPRELDIVDRIVPGGYAMSRKQLQRLTVRRFGGKRGHRRVETAGGSCELFQVKDNAIALPRKKKLILSISSLFHVYLRHRCASITVRYQLHNLLRAAAVVLSAANHGSNGHRIRQTGA